jgi:hypothetical protein
MVTIDEVISSILRITLSAADNTAVTNWKKIYQEYLYECLGIDEADKNDEAAYPFKANVLIGHVIALELLTSGSLSATSSAVSGDTFLKRAQAGSVEAEFGLMNEKVQTKLSVGDLYGKTLLKARGIASELGCWLSILDIEADADAFNAFILYAPGEAE